MVSGAAGAQAGDPCLGLLSIIASASRARANRFADAEVRLITAKTRRSITAAIRMRRHMHSYVDALAEADDRDEIVVGDTAVEGVGQPR